MLGPKCNNGFITFRTSGLLHLGPNFITFRTFITFTTLFRLGGERGGAESARADFNFRELP